MGNGQYASFDDFDNENEGQHLTDFKPFQFREDTSEEGTLKWLNDNFNELYMGSRQRLLSFRRFSNRCKNGGDSSTPGFTRESNREMGNTDDKPKVRTNFFQSYIDQKVAQVSKIKQNPVFIPLNDTEQDDINNAEACNKLVKYRLKQLNFDALMREQDEKTFKYGTSFAKVHWDTCAGPINPKYKEARKKFGKIPRLKDGKISDEEINAQEAKLGDVVVEIVASDCIFPERKKTKWEQVNYVEEISFESLAEVQAEYGDHIKKEEYFWLDVDGRGYNHSDVIMVHRFYHRPTKFLPNGAFIKYIEGEILEMVLDNQPEGEKRVFGKSVKDYMPDDELPYVVDFDIKPDDEFWARPFLVNIEQLNNMHDLIQSGIARNIGVASHPKLLVAANSVNLKQLDNKYGVVQWSGAHEPKWLQHNYVNRGEFEIQDRLEKKMDQQAKVFEVSKGYVPNGITAFSAIRYLDDQEVQANSATIEKRKERIKKIYWKVKCMMGRHYKPDDGRMAHLLGENNTYLIESFNKFDFDKLGGLDMENISALSDTRSGRISDILDLNSSNQKDPIFGRKEIIKLLDLGLEDAFLEEVSYAAITAKTILENLKHGKPAPAPEPTDDLIEMYMIFSRFVESLAYKTKLDPAKKKAVQEYIKGLEYMMDDKAKKNMAFSMKLKAFEKYPMFYSPGAAQVAPPPPGMPMPPMPPGQAGAPGKPFGNMQEKAMNELKPDQNGGMA